MNPGAPVLVRIGTSLRDLAPVVRAGIVLSANPRLVQVRIHDDTLTVPRHLVRAA